MASLLRRPAPGASRTGRLRGLDALPVLALVLVVVLAAIGSAFPDPALGATALASRCDGAALRAKPSSAARLVHRLPAGASVVAVARVSGTPWSVSCGGSSTGAAWWQITSVNGKSTTALYGAKQVYAAVGLFAATRSTTLATACASVPLRAGTSTVAPVRVRLAKGTRLGVVGTVAGGSWTTKCPGSTVSGTSWAVVSSVGGRSVQALYGVPYLFVTRGQLITPPAPTPTPTPTPIATPAGPTPSPTPSPTPDPYLHGIDVSHWQGTVDWPTVSGTDKVFVFLKASDVVSGVDYVDPTYLGNRAEAQAAGLLAGAYHFARPSGTTPAEITASAVHQADLFVSTAQLHPGDLLPVLDLEVGGLAVSMPVADLTLWVQSYLDEVWYQTGLRGIIYTSPSFWSNRLGNTAAFANQGYTLWLAHWTTGTPTVPGANWGGQGWTFWQYTSSGTVAGIGGRVDLDRFKYTDFTPWVISAIVPQPRPTPSPTPVPTPSPTPVPTPTP